MSKIWEWAIQNNVEVSLAIGLISLIIGLGSLVVSVCGMLQAKKAHNEAREANRKIDESNNQREIVDSWRNEYYNLQKLEDKKRLEAIFAMISRIDRSNMPDDNEKRALMSIKSSLKYHADDIDKKGTTNYATLCNVMSEAEGIVSGIIDNLYLKNPCKTKDV